MMITIAALKRHLGILEEDTTEDARLWGVVEAASATLHRTTQRRFEPWYGALSHDLDLCDVAEVRLIDDLLEWTEVSDAQGGIAPEDILRVPGGLRRQNGSFAYGVSPFGAVQVTGWWGWHDDWARAWRPSGENLGEALGPIATSIPVASASAPAPAGQRWEAGHLLRINDELLRVQAVDVESDRLAVARGVLGTVASAHSAGADLLIYAPPVDAAWLCLRLATWFYREPDRASEPPPGLWLSAAQALRRVRV